MKILIKILVFGLMLPAIYLLFILVFGYYNEYKPAEYEILKVDQAIDRIKITQSEITISSWNIGYAGLGKESNFFYDKGNPFLSGDRMIYASESLNRKNWNGVEEFIIKSQADIFLLQEIDQRSKRSYYQNQFLKLKNLRPDYTACFAKNYSNARIPIPILEPWNAYGRVLSGLATYSKYQPISSHRIQLPGEYPFPNSLFQLKRCLLAQEFDWNNNRLLLINLHNAAYDPKGEIKAQQLEFIRTFILQKYEEGYYVILGGDWNQCPPDFTFDKFSPVSTQGYKQYNIPDNYLPSDWQWVYDSSTSTNRKTAYPYKNGITFETIIDYFLVSPNLQVDSIKTIKQEFEYSDHQPVEITVQARRQE